MDKEKVLYCPEKYFSNEEIIEIFATIIKQIIKFNERSNNDNSYFSDFDSEFLLKTINLKEYLNRIVYYTKLNSEMIVVSLMYFDQFCKKNQEFTLNELNSHKLILCSIVMTIKFYDDFSITNKTLSVIGGVKVDELAKIEFLFYRKINFSLFLNEQLYAEYFEKLKTFQKMTFLY